jgi:hypothetical protein
MMIARRPDEFSHPKWHRFLVALRSVVELFWLW